MVASGTGTPGQLRGGQAADRRKVRAIFDAGDSDGWQHISSKDSGRQSPPRFPPPAVVRGGRQPLVRRVHRATLSSRRRRACSLRSRSVRLREATVISQPRGLSGMPSFGHWAAPRGAPLDASSAVSKCRNVALSRREPAAPAGAAGSRVGCQARSDQTSSSPRESANAARPRSRPCVPRPRGVRQPGGDLPWRVEAFAVHDPEASENFLGFRIGPSVTTGAALEHLNSPGVDRSVQA